MPKNDHEMLKNLSSLTKLYIQQFSSISRWKKRFQKNFYGKFLTLLRFEIYLYLQKQKELILDLHFKN